ncbi:TRNA-splicing endonuclease subunit Sen15 [Aix galericulata]|nr:TRNA-splicing endonuclease subunit Sen15 [Aix galericulata]
MPSTQDASLPAMALAICLHLPQPTRVSRRASDPGPSPPRSATPKMAPAGGRSGATREGGVRRGGDRRPPHVRS